MQSLNGYSSDATPQYLKTHLPSLYQLVRLGQESRFFKLVEKSFQLLNDLQFCCLPLHLRGLCVTHYVSTQTAERQEEMSELYEAWLDKETEAIEAEFGCLDDLPEEQAKLIPFIRQSIFTVLYEEQGTLKAEDPFHPFLSVCNSEGEKNTEYFKYVEKKEKAKAEQRQPLIKRKIERFEQFQAHNLAKNGVATTKLSKQDKALLDKATASITQAFLNLSLEETTQADKDYFLFDLTAAKLDVLKDQQSLSHLEATRKLTEEYIAKEITNDKWKAYLAKEAKAFEVSYGFSLEQMDPKLKNFRTSVRTIIYRLIYQEQPEDTPFVSICDKDGALNENYWIDLLNAQARKNLEKPREDYCDLEDLPDCEIIRINSAPAQAKDDGKTDSTNLRQTGAVTPKFCRNVLESMKQFSDETKKRFTSTVTVEAEHELFKPMFVSSALSLYEKIRLLQDEFSSTVAVINYVRGYTKGLLQKLNITYNPSGNSLLVILNSADKRKSQTFGRPREFAHLRKSGPIEISHQKPAETSRPIAIRKPSGTAEETLLLRKSQNSQTPSDPMRKSASTPHFESSFETTSLEDECSTFQQELEAIRKHKKRTVSYPLDGEYDEILQCINVYASSLKSLGQQLNKFGLLVQHFATGLKHQEETRLQKLAAQAFDESGTSPRRRGTSIRKLAASPPSSVIKIMSSRPTAARGSTGVIALPALALSASPKPLGKSPGDELHPLADDSPRIENMNPIKFTETGNLCLLVQRIFMDVAQLLSSELHQATEPTNPKPLVEDDEYML